MPKEIPSRYPFTEVGAAEEIEKEELVTLERADVGDGAGKPPRKVPKAFLKQEESEAPRDRLRIDKRTSEWLHAHANRGSSLQAVFQDTLKRARRAPSREALEHTRTVLNELGRKRGGAKQLRALITQDVVDEFLEKGD